MALAVRWLLNLAVLFAWCTTAAAAPCEPEGGLSCVDIGGVDDQFGRCTLSEVFDCTGNTTIDIFGDLIILNTGGILCRGSDAGVRPGAGLSGDRGFNVTINVVGNLIVEGFISADGGTGGSGTTGANGGAGGDGGSVDIDVCGDVTLSSSSLISARGGIGGAGASGSRNGGNGSVGGSGGVVSIDADFAFTQVSDGGMDVSGGGGGTGGAGGFGFNGGSGGPGGTGGTVDIFSCATDIAGFVGSGGGMGGSGGPGGGVQGDGGNNGSGGDGGAQNIASGTHVLFQLSSILLATGGHEGPIGSGNPAGTDVADGGNGGTITTNHCAAFSVIDSGAVFLLQGGIESGADGAIFDLNTAECCDCQDSSECDDGNACTDDDCACIDELCEGRRCISSPNTAPCDDADQCTEDDACTNRVCRGHRICVGSGFDPAADQPPVEGTRFGAAVALAGQQLLVGAPSDAEGAAYVFDIDPDRQSAVLRFSLPNPEPADTRDFGTAVAFAAQGEDIVVSALGKDDFGAVYVFSGATGGEPRLSLYDPQRKTAGAFGSAVAVVGEHILVGDPSGCVAYLFDASGILRTSVLDPDIIPVGCGAFGAAVADAGDGAMLVGDPVDRRVFLFSVASGERLRTYSPPTSSNQDEFGAAVAALGQRVLVGAPGAGVAYLFDRDTGALVGQLANPAPQPGGGRFGATVGFLDEGRLLAGAPRNELRPPDTLVGVAYVFDADTRTVIETLRHPEPGRPTSQLNSDDDNSKRHEFGAAIAIDTSNGPRVLIGSPRTVGGTAYLFASEPAELVFGLEGPGAGSFFGASVVVLDDEILVGAPGATAESRGKAAGSVYRVDADTGEIVGSFRNPLPTDGQRFGASVAAGPTVVAIGAPGDDAKAGDAGAVFGKNYDGTDSYVLTSPEPAAGDGFGTAVAFVGSAPGGRGAVRGCRRARRRRRLRVRREDPASAPQQAARGGWSLPRLLARSAGRERSRRQPFR